MRRTVRLWHALVLGLVMVVLLGACGPSGSTPAPSPSGGASTSSAAPANAAGAPQTGTTAVPPSVAPLNPAVPVHIGILQVTALAPFVIAEERGYFAEEGLVPEFTRFDSGARMVAPLAAGQIVAGMGAHSAGLFNALATGVQVKVVASNAVLVPGRSPSTIVARKSLVDTGFTATPEQLRGKSIAYTASGSTVHVNVGRYLELKGLREDEVNGVELGQPDMNPALANGAVDLANQTEPYVTLGIEQGYLTRIASVADYYPNREVSVVLYGGPFIQDQPEAARRLMVAYLRGVRAYEDAFTKGIDHDDILDILVKRLPVKDGSLYDRMYQNGTLSYANPDGYLATESIAWDQDWMVRNGMVRTPVDIGQVVDNQFIEYALGRLGRYAR